MLYRIVDTLEGYDFAVADAKDNPPAYVDKNHPIIQTLTNICNRQLGLSLEPYVMGGGTYARKLKNAVGYGPGIPGSGSKFGPERGRGHQPDEYIELELLRKAIHIYAEAIKAIDELLY